MGKVEFAAPVVGIIRTGGGLAASDDELTATKFADWPDARGWMAWRPTATRTAFG